MPKLSFLKVFTCALFITIIMSFAVSAYAKAGEDDVKNLRSVFSEILSQYSDAARSNGADLVQEGRILIEPSDNYYAITLPHLSVKQKDGSYTDIGMIAINAIKGDDEHQWKMTVALPTPIIHYDSNKKPVVTTNIAAQNFAGLWHEKLNNFLKMNVRYKNVEIKQHSEQTRIIIPDTVLIYDLKEDDQQRWSGPANLDISGLKMFFDRDGSTASIDKMTMSSTVNDYSIDEALSYQEKINALAESYQDEEDPNLSGPHVIGLYNLIFDFMGQAWDGFDFKVGMENFVITRPPIPGSSEGHIKIKDGSFGFDMGGFREGSVHLGLTFGYNGFEMAPITQDYNEATPDHVNFDLKINNLPYKEIVELGRSSIQGSLKNPDAGKLMGLQALMTLPQLLTKAQTNITLNDTRLGNKKYNVLTNGKFTADLAAKMGMVGKARTEIFGLDGLIDSLKAASENPDLDDAKKKNIQDTIQGLGILHMFGQIEDNAKGEKIRVYNLELNQQGEALLNGSDLQMIMQPGK